MIPVIFQSLLGAVRVDLAALKRGMFQFVMPKGPSNRNSLDNADGPYVNSVLRQLTANL